MILGKHDSDAEPYQNPHYTIDDLPRLDALHIALGIGSLWLGSEQRQRILIEETESNSETA